MYYPRVLHPEDGRCDRTLELHPYVSGHIPVCVGGGGFPDFKLPLLSSFNYFIAVPKGGFGVCKIRLLMEYWCCVLLALESQLREGGFVKVQLSNFF